VARGQPSTGITFVFIKPIYKEILFVVFKNYFLKTKSIKYIIINQLGYVSIGFCVLEYIWYQEEILFAFYLIHIKSIKYIKTNQLGYISTGFYIHV